VPTRQAKDGSDIVGRVEASVTVDATAIPRLRLSAASTPLAPQATDWWTRPASSGPQPPVASPHPSRNATRQRLASSPTHASSYSD